MLFPTLVRAIAQRELKTAVRHCRTLLLLKAGCVSEREQKRRGKLAKEHGFELDYRERGTTWKQAAERQKIPQPYWPLVKFPEFSPRSFGRWFKFLWPLIREKIKLSKLPSLSQRDLDKGGSPLESTAEMQPQLQPCFAEIVGHYFPILHATQMRRFCFP